MPISFLVPAFLAGLAMLTVPLLLHLRRRDRRKPVAFPSLMFLERIAVVTDQRRRITDWPLLLLRALAIAILVAAFARPFLRRSVDLIAADTGLTVLLLDRSASMSADGISNAWADSALAVVDALQPGRRIAVVAFDAGATILSAPSADRGAARAAVAAAPVAAGPTRFSAGLRAASQLLTTEAVPGEVIVVSDLQRGGTALGGNVPLPRGTVVRAVGVEPLSRENSSVTGLEIEPVLSGTVRRALIAARLTRFGEGVSRSIDARLDIDGREVAIRTVTLEPGASVRVSFDTVPLPREAARVAVRITADGFPADDVAFAVAPAEAGPRVLLVSPPDARPDEYRYVEAALSVSGDPRFEIRRASRLDSEAIRQSDLVVLLDVAAPTGDVAAALDQWVQGGGGLITTLGPRLGARRGGNELLHGESAGNRQNDAGVAVGLSGASHPALTAFQGSAADALSSVRVRRYVDFRPSDDASVPLRFDDGGAAVTSSSHGEGRTVVIAIPVDGRRGDFPLQPAFVPVVRGLAAWASGSGSEPLAITSGSSWQLPATVMTPVLRGPTGDLIRPGGSSRFVSIRESGIYEVLDGGGVAVTLVAVNAPISESDLAAIDPDELLLGVEDAEPGVAAAPAQLSEASEAGQQWWRWILALLLVILIVEAWMASSGWRGAAAPVTAATDRTGGMS